MVLWGKEFFTVVKFPALFLKFLLLLLSIAQQQQRPTIAVKVEMGMKIAIENKTKARKYFAVHNGQPDRRIIQGKKWGKFAPRFPTTCLFRELSLASGKKKKGKNPSSYHSTSVLYVGTIVSPQLYLVNGKVMKESHLVHQRMPFCWDHIWFTFTLSLGREMWSQGICLAITKLLLISSKAPLKANIQCKRAGLYRHRKGKRLGGGGEDTTL